MNELGGGENEIEPTVIVKVEEDGAPTDRAARPHDDAGFLRHVVKGAIALVLQQHHAIHHIGEIDVQVEVIVVIADRQSHAVDHRAGAGFDGYFRPAPAAASGAVVPPENIAEHILELIIDDIDIGVAVAVVVGKASAESRAQEQIKLQQMRDISEGAVSLVAIKRVAGGVVLPRDIGVATLGKQDQLTTYRSRKLSPS